MDVNLRLREFVFVQCKLTVKMEMLVNILLTFSENICVCGVFPYFKFCVHVHKISVFQSFCCESESVVT